MLLGHSEGGHEQHGVADGLPALVRFVRNTFGADFAVVFEAEADNFAIPVASDPWGALQPFSLDGLKLQSIDWFEGRGSCRAVLHAKRHRLGSRRAAHGNSLHCHAGSVW